MLIDAGLTEEEVEAWDRTCGYNHGQMSLWDPPQAIPPTGAVRLVESVDDLLLDEGVA